MSIMSMYRSSLVQKAVYWGNPVNNGYNKFTYDSPIEIDCRWEGKEQLLRTWDGGGLTLSYIGIVWVDQDLDENGCLFLGTLDDLDSGAEEEPLSMDTVFRIQQFEKLPRMRSTTEFIRRAFLSPWQYR
jgi:hypothetical protein